MNIGILNSSIACICKFETAHFSRFRKRLGVYSYKIGKQYKFKNTHAVPLATKNKLKKVLYDKLIIFVQLRRFLYFH